ncbi:hypothetical protein A3I18_02285 [Candidatus Campbellbacteria bacterium RIFCSPLOWO2_02_FULL_35_11]|uniref:SpoVT-AbrB domain-containing protein n=1 Tax=Candidatus Campbellbacteria bacterium RIFCSPLOWO2_02_FULL_35_11 TaxID=1797581 RepID=A0A1F5ES29_9BACT|nr:MAG: hypothetical protein A3I18_02285 [Candidatus Campbellbacteria bacterium RIFCSPLOWO2_02_FULL_35_11]
MLLKIQSRGTITIPKELRESLNLKEGDFLDANLKNGKITIEPIEVINKDLQKKVLQYLNKK